MIFETIPSDYDLPNMRLTYDLLNALENHPTRSVIGAVKNIRELVRERPDSSYYSLVDAKQLVDTFDTFLTEELRKGSRRFSVVTKRDDAATDRAAIAIMACFLGFSIQLADREPCA